MLYTFPFVPAYRLRFIQQPIFEQVLIEILFLFLKKEKNNFNSNAEANCVPFFSLVFHLNVVY